jgi:hypothetical protein
MDWRYGQVYLITLAARRRKVGGIVLLLLGLSLQQANLRLHLGPKNSNLEVLFL